MRLFVRIIFVSLVLLLLIASGFWGSASFGKLSNGSALASGYVPTKTIGASSLSGPMDVEVSKDGSLFVSNISSKVISHFDSSGKLINTFGAGILEIPIAIALDDKGYLYVSDPEPFSWPSPSPDPDMVHKFSISGEHISSWSREGMKVQGIDVGPDGEIYVGDVKKINIFSDQGVFIRSIPARFADSIVVGDQSLYAAEGSNNGAYAVVKIGFDGEEIFGFGDGPGQGQNDCSSGIAMLSSDRIATSNCFGGNVIVYGADGEYQQDFGVEGADFGMLDNPMGLAVDDDDQIYVADYSNNRVQLFSPGLGFERLNILAVWAPKKVQINQRANLRVSILNSGTIAAGYFSVKCWGPGVFGVHGRESTGYNPSVGAGAKRSVIVPVRYRKRGRIGIRCSATTNSKTQTVISKKVYTQVKRRARR